MSDLDKLFKKKLEQRSFEFKDAYWQEAEQLIAAEEGKRRRRVGWWIFGLLFMLTIAAGAFYYSQVDQAPIPTTASNEPLVNTETSELNLRSTNIESTSANDKEKLSNSTTEISNSAPSSSEKEPTQSEIASLSKNAANRTGYAAESRRTDVIGQSISEYKTNTKASDNSQLTIDNKSAFISPANNEEVISTSDQSKEASEQSYERSAPDADTPAPASKSEKIASLVALDLLETRGLELLDIAEEERTLSKSIKVSQPKRWQIGLDIASLHQFSNSTGQYSGIALGAVGDFKLDRRWSVQGGLRYSIRQPQNFLNLGNSSTASNRNNSSDNTFVSTTNFYNFGLIQVDEITDVQQFHFIELPVNVQFRAKRHLFAVGAQLNYLSGVRGEQALQTSSPDLNSSTGVDPVGELLGSSIPGSNNKGWLDRSPYNKWSSEAFISYGFILSPKWTVNLGAHFQLFNNGLNDSISGEANMFLDQQGPLGVQTTDRVYFRLGMRYTIGR